jgi:hypothetical protein
VLAFEVTAAHADVTISTAATQDMSCTEGVCAPTAASAVLNAGDLESMLASGDIKVTTTGSGVQSQNIVVAAQIAWSSTSALALDAYQSIEIRRPLAMQGLAALSLTTNDGGQGGVLEFGGHGHVTFANLSSSLSINAVPYTLVGSVKDIASSVSANPTGKFALAADYDAKVDGIYTTAPVGTELDGRFEGLGNAISNLTISDQEYGGTDGLFTELGDDGLIENLTLANLLFLTNADEVGGLVGFSSGQIYSVTINGAVQGGEAGCLAGETTNGPIENIRTDCKVGGITTAGGLVGSNSATISQSRAMGGVNGIYAGGLVGRDFGQIRFSSATGKVSGLGDLGGLVGLEDGSIDHSWAGGSVNSNLGSYMGGLVGYLDGGAIDQSFAMGRVAGDNGSIVGGLVGTLCSCEALTSLTNSYATGAVRARGGFVGGLVGHSDGSPIGDSYSTGMVRGVAHSDRGGFVGYDGGPGQILDGYWDTTTSNITDPSQGTGNVANDPGITGLTTAQLQSGLPAGFSNTIWAENPNINRGLPYLTGNPPAK